MNEEETKEYIRAKRNLILSCADLSKYFMGRHKVLPVYLTPQFEREFNYKMAKAEELKQENKKLKDQLEQSIAVSDTNSELAESYYNEIKKLKEQYCERTDCSGRIGNSKKVEEVQQENKQLRGSLQTHEILLQANVEENQKLKKQISNLECLVESIKLGVTLNQYQEDLLDKILFRSDK